MVSHISPDSLRMPPHAVGDRLPWGDCPALSYAISLPEATGRGTVVLGTYGDERQQCPTGAWLGPDHARREGDLLWGIPGGTALECTTDTVHRTRSRPGCALGRQRTPLLPVLLVE